MSGPKRATNKYKGNTPIPLTTQKGSSADSREEGPKAAESCRASFTGSLRGPMKR